jgi:hypothetical protein
MSSMTLPIPNNLICVICLQIFEEPCFASDGYTYCRLCLFRWAGNKQWISPRTNCSIRRQAIIRSDEGSASSALAAKHEAMKEDMKDPHKALLSVACSYSRGRPLASSDDNALALQLIAFAPVGVRSFIHALEVISRDSELDWPLNFTRLVMRESDLIPCFVSRDAEIGPFIRIGVLLDIFQCALSLIPQDPLEGGLMHIKILLDHISKRFELTDHIVVPKTYRNRAQRGGGLYIRCERQREVPNRFVRFICEETDTFLDAVSEDQAGRGSQEEKHPTHILHFSDGSKIDFWNDSNALPIECEHMDYWAVRRGACPPVFPDYDPSFDPDFVNSTPLWGEEAFLSIYEKKIGAIPDGFTYSATSSTNHIIRMQLNLHREANVALLDMREACSSSNLRL